MILWPIFPFLDNEKFELNLIDPVECRAGFCVEKNYLPLLYNALGILEVIESRQRRIYDGLEGFVRLFM